MVNLTAVEPTRDTFLSVSPTTSSLNVMRGEITPNQVTVAVDEDLDLAVRNNSGSVHVLVDLVGYYSPDEGSAFHAITPTRAYDSRPGTQWLPPYTQRRVPLGAVLPAEAETVLFNLTGLANYYGTYLTTWQAGQPRPGTSTLNLNDLQVASNQAVVSLGVQRSVDVYNYFGYTNIVVDVSGYFAPRAS